MKAGTAQKISNAILSCMAGFASFVFSLAALLYLTELDEKVLAALVAGAFCLLISYIASERPNSENARALAALADRLLAVEHGDMSSPAPDAVRKSMPKVAAAVDNLFSEVRTSLENAHALGMYDPVTSLPNRLHFRSEADKLLADANSAATSAMLFVDLDRFKSVNDSLGHARGDQLLVMVANRLRVAVNAEFAGDPRQRPLLARLAGDEFTILFPKIESAACAERAARRIVQAVGEPFELGAHKVDIGASVGFAIAPDHGTSVEALMRAADSAMYRAKERGGGRHHQFDDKLASEHRQRIETEKALTQAVERGEFALAFQPQMNLSTGALCGAEALLRWRHPRDGLRLPESFLGDAERTGAVAEIGDWTMSEVAAMLAANARLTAGGRLSFNVSPRQLERGDFSMRLRHALADAHVPLAQIELELSESAAVHAGDALLDELRALRSDGASIAVDDFGTGFSNIARLHAMPVDRVKLDPLLTAEIESNEKARVTVQAAIQLIKGVGFQAIAEAVERQEQADILRAMGCDAVQGFICAPPMFEAEFNAWLDARSESAQAVA